MSIKRSMRRIRREDYTPDKYRKDVELVEAVEGTFSIDFSNPERHLRDKIEIIMQVLGYDALRVGSDKHEIRFLPVEKCKPERLTLMLRDAYMAAKKRVENYGNPENRGKGRVDKNSGLIRQAKEYLEGERGLEGSILEDAQARTANVLADLTDNALVELSGLYGRKVMGGFYRE